jgi:hypothetical protein
MTVYQEDFDTYSRKPRQFLERNEMGLSVVEACRWISNSMVVLPESLNILRSNNRSRFDNDHEIDIDRHLS